MRKVIPFLSSVAIMVVLTFHQRLFLVQTDSGKQWADMAMWFGLCNWLSHTPKTGMVSAHQPETTTARPSRAAGTGGVRNRGARNPFRFDDSDPGPRSLVCIPNES